MLYRPDAFERLTDARWSERRVRRAIGEIVDDADTAYSEADFWPADDWDAWGSSRPLKTLYVGAAGVVWGLDRLRARGYAAPRLDLARATQRALEAWREHPGVLTALDLPEPAHASLLMGEAGILTVLWQLDPERGIADDLHAHVRANAGNVAHDVMWGAPGTMLAALAMLGWTKENRWERAWRESASALLEARDVDGLWTQHLYGEVYRGLGPVRGAVGNVLALLQGEELLQPGKRDQLRQETNGLLARTAVVEDGLANWPGAEGHDLVAGDRQIRVQWDCGAPGIVASTAAFLAGWRSSPPTVSRRRARTRSWRAGTDNGRARAGQTRRSDPTPERTSSITRPRGQRRAGRSPSASCRRECPSPRARPSWPEPCPPSPR